MPWYSAIGIFRHKLKDRNAIPQYEERVVLVQSKSSGSAKKAILAEFSKYVKTDGIQFLNEYAIEELFDRPGEKVIEVAHLMRVSKLTPRRYIERYWLDQKPKSCGKVGWKHSWHNRNDKTSACYNCQEVRTGQLWK